MRSRYARRHGTTRTGFTLVELLVVIAIIGILMSLLVPTVFGLLDSNRTASCMRKLKEQHTFYMVAVENAGNKVKANTVRLYAQRYVPDGSAGSEIWGCDSDPLFDIEDIDKTISYGYNLHLHRLSGGMDGKRIVALDYKQPVVEAVGWETQAAGERLGNPHGDWEANVAKRHSDMVNVMFHSGTVKTMDPEELDPTKAAIQIKYWIPKAVRATMDLYNDQERDSFIPVIDFYELPKPHEDTGKYGLEREEEPEPEPQTD